MNRNANNNEISKGIIRSRNNGDGVGAGSTIFEVLFISVFMGIYFSSWWLLGGLLLGLSILMYFKITRLILIVIFGIGWVVIAWLIGDLFGSLGASVVLSLITLLISFAVHRAAYEEWKEGF